MDLQGIGACGDRLANHLFLQSKAERTHAFDAGAALQLMALQGAAMDIVVHGMEGFSYDRARTDLKIPEGYDVHAMAAIGRIGRPETLAPELQAREVPSERRPIRDTIIEGIWRK